MHVPCRAELISQRPSLTRALPHLRNGAGSWRHAQSWLGWPVPRRVRIASRARLATLTQAARARGFSRKGESPDLETGRTFLVIPYLPEPSPEPSWMCLVVASPHSMNLEPGVRPEPAFARLDVAGADLRSLPVARSKVRDQLLHWMAWEAYRGRSREPGPAQGLPRDRPVTASHATAHHPDSLPPASRRRHRRPERPCRCPAGRADLRADGAGGGGTRRWVRGPWPRGVSSRQGMPAGSTAELPPVFTGT